MARQPELVEGSSSSWIYGYGVNPCELVRTLVGGCAQRGR